LDAVARNPAPPPTKSQPLDDEQPPPGQSGLVLVWMETTPPAARIVRVSDGHVLGYSPEIIEFSYTKKPVQIRFELEGYIPLTREVSAAVDAELKFVLEPIPKAPLRRPRSPRGARATRDPTSQKSGHVSVDEAPGRKARRGRRRCVTEEQRKNGSSKRGPKL
jgi:hypothetical protein